MLERPLEYRRMAEVEAVHWWYRALHERVISAIESQFPERHDLAVLDAGCGTGGLLERLKVLRPSARLRGIDLSEHAVVAARGRGFAVEQGDIRDVVRKFRGEIFDVIVLNDVNYFIPLDEWPRLLNEYASLLGRGGLIIVNAPAFPAFRGTHDVAVGIAYRLKPEQVGNLFDASRLERIETRCWPFVLSPVIWVMRALQRRALRHDMQQDVLSDVDLPSRPLNAFLFWVTRLERSLSARLAVWGSSLFIVLRRVP